MLASGAGNPRQLISKSNYIYPFQWSTDGQILMFGEVTSENGADILFHFTDNSRPDLRLTPNRDAETLARFSPNTDFVCYTSRESGTLEVYVQPFPPTGEERWMVSSGGGTEPVWSPTGDKIYYRNGTSWMEARIATKPDFPGYSYDITQTEKNFCC